MYEMRATYTALEQKSAVPDTHNLQPTNSNSERDLVLRENTTHWSGKRRLSSAKHTHLHSKKPFGDTSGRAPVPACACSQRWPSRMTLARLHEKNMCTKQRTNGWHSKQPRQTDTWTGGRHICGDAGRMGSSTGRRQPKQPETARTRTQSTSSRSRRRPLQTNQAPSQGNALPGRATVAEVARKEAVR